MGRVAKNKVYVSTNKQKPLHPNSRKALQVSRQFKKDAKLDKLRGQKNMKLQMLGIKLAFFKENLDTTLEKCSPQYLHELIESYIHRNDEELQQIKLKKAAHGNKRQHASRQDALTFAAATERKEYDVTGFEVVNLLEPETFMRFKEWEGDIRFIPTLTMKRFVKSDLLKD